MRNGLLLEEGASAIIFGAAQHPYTRSLLGAVPTLKTDRDRPLATLARGTGLDAGVLREAEERHWVRQA
jgi:peptide/nickel transport system ATP-binding protein